MPSPVARHRLGAIGAEAAATLHDVSAGPSDALIGPLARAHDKFARQLHKAQRRHDRPGVCRIVGQDRAPGRRQRHQLRAYIGCLVRTDAAT